MFIGAIAGSEISVLIASLFIICMLLLATALMCLVYEVFLATRTIHKNEPSSEVIITRIKD
jgi:hypothetical protein